MRVLTSRFLELVTLAVVSSGLAGATGCFATPTPAGRATNDPAAAGAMPDAGTRGCDYETVPPAMAPNGYYTHGATVCDADGQPHLFHGVDRPSLEWSPAGDQLSPDDFQAMADWNANVVRIALNQDFWLSRAALYDSTYAHTVTEAVHWAEAAGLDVILDLHWSDRGDLSVTAAGEGTKQNTSGGSNQQQMADANSVEFWTEVATVFKDDGRVLFELYNEPNSIGWNVWLNGGLAAGFQVAGMQRLHDAVRATGAENLVIAGGLDWAFDLSGVRQSPIVGHNILYATHPYDKSDNQPASWENSFGYLATGNIAPVIVTEFGDGRSNCTGAWDSQLIQFADAHGISWTAWAWYAAADSCSFPALISDWSPTTTVQGDVVKGALLGYPRRVFSIVDAGADTLADVVMDNAAETNTAETNTAEANTAEANTAETNTAETNTAETNTAEDAGNDDAADGGPATDEAITDGDAAGGGADGHAGASDATLSGGDAASDGGPG